MLRYWTGYPHAVSDFTFPWGYPFKTRAEINLAENVIFKTTWPSREEIFLNSLAWTGNSLFYTNPPSYSVNKTLFYISKLIFNSLADRYDISFYILHLLVRFWSFRVSILTDWVTQLWCNTFHKTTHMKNKINKSKKRYANFNSDNLAASHSNFQRKYL